MTGRIYTSLSWLRPPETPPSSAMRALDAADAGIGATACRLARHRLGFLDLDRLGRKLSAFVKAGADLAPLMPLRMALIDTGTLDLIAPSLVASAARHGFALDCRVGCYGQALNEALSPRSELNTSPVDVVLIALDHRSLPFDCRPGNVEDATGAVHAAASLIQAMVMSIKKGSGATCIIQTVAPPPEALFGSLDRRVAGTPRSLLLALTSRSPPSQRGRRPATVRGPGEGVLRGRAWPDDRQHERDRDGADGRPDLRLPAAFKPGHGRARRLVRHLR